VCNCLLRARQCCFKSCRRTTRIGAARYRHPLCATCREVAATRSCAICSRRTAQRRTPTASSTRRTSASTRRRRGRRRRFPPLSSSVRRRRRRHSACTATSRWSRCDLPSCPTPVSRSPPPPGWPPVTFLDPNPT